MLVLHGLLGFFLGCLLVIVALQMCFRGLVVLDCVLVVVLAACVWLLWIGWVWLDVVSLVYAFPGLLRKLVFRVWLEGLVVLRLLVCALVVGLVRCSKCRKLVHWTLRLTEFLGRRLIA